MLHRMGLLNRLDLGHVVGLSLAFFSALVACLLATVLLISLISCDADPIFTSTDLMSEPI